MKISKLVPLILVFVFTLTACQLFSSGSAPATEVPMATEAPAATEAGAVPYPEGSQVALPVISSGAYPSPEAQLTPMAAGEYPAPGGTLPAAAAMAYPSPAAKSLVAQVEPVYPDLKDGAEVAMVAGAKYCLFRAGGEDRPDSRLERLPDAQRRAHLQNRRAGHR